eukprot:scaffold46177_cov34-Tisochrysis_lutea.AAC.3
MSLGRRGRAVCSMSTVERKRCPCARDGGSGATPCGSTLERLACGMPAIGHTPAEVTGGITEANDKLV